MVKTVNSVWINVTMLCVIAFFLSTQISAKDEIAQNLLVPIHKSKKSRRMHTRMRSESKYPLAGESESVITDFRVITRLFERSHKNLSTSHRDVSKKLLDRLDRLNPKTFFVKGQINLVKSSLYYSLSMSDKADLLIQENVTNSPYMSIREESVRVYVSYKYMSDKHQDIIIFRDKYSKYLSSDINLYLDLMVRFPDNITSEESSYIINTLIITPRGSYQHPGIDRKMLRQIKRPLKNFDLDQAISHFLFDSNIFMSILIMKMRLENSEVDLQTLSSWHYHARFYEASFIRMLRSVSDISTTCREFLVVYDQELSMRCRGELFYKKLYKYEGGHGVRYNVAHVEKIFQQYLKGSVEPMYIEKNTEIVFRNFLSEKKYDKIIDYADKIEKCLKKPIDSVYINFWKGYALFKVGRIDESVSVFGVTLAKDPESYYGILSRNLLNKIFETTDVSLNEYIKTLKSESKNSRENSLDYATILYYLDSCANSNKAKKIFLSQGVPYCKTSGKISSSKELLIKSYVALGLEKEARQLAHNDGMKSVYLQDAILGKLLSQDRQQDRLNRIIEGRSIYLTDKKIFSLGKVALGVYYPQPYQESIEYAIKHTDISIDSNLIYSIIRTESSYRDRIHSHVGATGLMQVMPKTGKWLMSRYFPHIKTYSLTSPDTNIALGSVYIYEIIKKYGLLSALAAYNSGPGTISRLSKQYGVSDLELVEIHPKQETRDYVKRVIESYQKYLYVYGDESLDVLK